MGYVGEGSKKSVLRRGLDSLGRINYFARGRPPLPSGGREAGILRGATESLAADGGAVDADSKMGAVSWGEVPAVFPVPSVIAERFPPAEDLRRRQEWRQVGPIRDYKPWWVRVREWEDGKFILETTNKEEELMEGSEWRGGVHLSKGAQSAVTPGAGLSAFSHVDVRGFDLSDGVIEGGRLEGARFDCCKLDRTVIRYGADNVSFDGASLRGFYLRNRVSDVSMVGADVTDADFSEAVIWGDVDVTDSNITRRQYDQMRENLRSGSIKYRRYSVDDFLLATGMDKETFLVTAWASGLDLRDDNGEPTNNIDGAHVPQWEMQRIAVQGW